jgi:hypothetical protein
MKFVLALVVGCVAGYYLGYTDGAAGKPPIVTRVVNSVGGGSRERVSNDIDAKMEKLEGGATSDPKKAGKAP